MTGRILIALLASMSLYAHSLVARTNGQPAERVINDTAATTYFKKTTSAPLREKFRPIVDSAMQKVGVAQQYEALVGEYTKTPFTSAPKLDLNGYVTDQALAGLFKVVGDEEKKIRKDPAARATDLLKQVFGH